MTKTAKRPWQTVLSYVTVYLAWLGVISLSGLGFFIMRAAIDQWYVVLALPPSAHKATDRVYLYLVGVFWIFLIFLAEGYFRQGVEKDDLTRRLRRVYIGVVTYLAIGMLLLGVLEAYFIWFT